MNKKLLVLNLLISFVFIYFFPPIGQIQTEEIENDIVRRNLEERLKTVYSLNVSLVKENKKLASQLEEARRQQDSLLKQLKLLTEEKENSREKSFSQREEERVSQKTLCDKIDNFTSQEEKFISHIRDLSHLRDLSHWPDEEKYKKKDREETTQNLKEWLEVVQKERDYYKKMAEDCKAKIAQEREEFFNIEWENRRLRQEVTTMHYNLGNLFFEQAKYKEAIMEYERALSLPQSYYNLAVVYTHLGNYKKALSCLREYLKLAPKLTSQQKKKIQKEISYLQDKAKPLAP